MIPASLRRLFSVPRYLSLPAAGIDISDRAIKFVELRQSVRGVRVRHHGRRDLPDQVVVKGQITNAQRLADELALVGNEISTKFVNVSLPEEQAYLFNTTVPHMKADAIRDSLSLQMERFVPIPLQDIIFDFDVVATTHDSFQIQVVAIDRKTVYSYLNVFQKAGFTVVMFELEPQSTARALLLEGDKETVMIVDFGDTHTGISIIKDGYVLFTTTSDITGENYERLIQKKRGIEVFEAQKIKRTYGLLEHHEAEDLTEDLRFLTQTLAKDLQKTVQYWQTQSANKRITDLISRVYFCGGNAHMPGLLPFLQDNTTIPIEKADPWIRIRMTDNQYAPVIQPDIALSYSSAIGLAIAGIQI